MIVEKLGGFLPRIILSQNEPLISRRYHETIDLTLQSLSLFLFRLREHRADNFARAFVHFSRFTLWNYLIICAACERFAFIDANL